MNHRDTFPFTFSARRRLRALNVNGLILCAAVSLWFHSEASAQEPPLANRPAQFSRIVGSYTIEVRATPVEVPVEEPITLHVTIAGKGLAQFQPDRKYLQLFPESWSRDFYVEPVPDEDRASPEDGTWDFVYRLRPKHQKVTAIDGIKLVYYEPAGKGGKYQTRYAEPIEIAVKPRRPVPELSEGLAVQTAPASFYELPSTEALLTEWPGPETLPAWALLFLIAPPILTIVAVSSVRRFGPPKRRRRERSATAQHALRELGTASGEPVWAVLTRYLHERLGFAAAEATPSDVERFLRQRGASRAMAEQVAVLLRDCDAVRFAGAAAAGPSRERAAQPIGALEDDLCDA